ncbi:hypothetical protein D6D19_05769 [Aureobasidium pullulans]|uniref:Rhodopsin domain-containing protein n=1 Tax=Aureobasidium pullulans TaxID=5580 RepID=A0A4V6TAH4_AURPU|nr:hypothetical protein D6D19_05769 [Aureobasidium pullulans]
MMDSTLISSSSRSMIQGIAGTAIGLSSVLVIVHIISRRVARASIWWDDGLLWLGGCMTLVMNALFIHGAQLGLGSYEEQLSTSQLEDIFKILFTNNLLHLWALAAVKASLLLFFNRMFASSNNTLRWTVYFSLCLIFVWVIIFSAISVFQCTPVSFFWSSGVIGKCITSDFTSRTAIAICDAVFNVATDFLCLMAPFQVLRRLQLANGKKAGLAVVYLLGGCKVVITIIRVLYQMNTPYTSSSDSLYSTFAPTIFVIIEINLAIACACLPSFTVMDGRAIFVKTKTKTKTKIASRSNTPEIVEPPNSPYSRPGQQFSDTSLFLQEFKRQPQAEFPILTTITSNVSEEPTRLPSLELGSFAQSSVFDILKPAGGIVKTLNVEQTIEEFESVRTLNVEQTIEEYDYIMRQASFSIV